MPGRVLGDFDLWEGVVEQGGGIGPGSGGGEDAVWDVAGEDDAGCAEHFWAEGGLWYVGVARANM